MLATVLKKKNLSYITPETDKNECFQYKNTIQNGRAYLLKPSKTWNQKFNLCLISPHTHAASPWSSYYFSCSVIRLAVHQGSNRVPQLGGGVQVSSGSKGHLSANRYAPLNWQQNSPLGGRKHAINLSGLFRGFCHKFQSQVILEIRFTLEY